MVFCKIIGHVDGTLSPKELKMFLLDAVFDPIKAHVESFREFLPHVRVEDSGRGGIIIVDGCVMCRLCVA